LRRGPASDPPPREGGQPAASVIATRTPGPDRMGSVEAEESMRGLARALVVSAIETYELRRQNLSLQSGRSPKRYHRSTKKWGRAA
jgi:hypothetical protein